MFGKTNFELVDAIAVLFWTNTFSLTILFLNKLKNEYYPFTFHAWKFSALTYCVFLILWLINMVTNKTSLAVICYVLVIINNIFCVAIMLYFIKKFTNNNIKSIVIFFVFDGLSLSSTLITLALIGLTEVSMFSIVLIVSLNHSIHLLIFLRYIQKHIETPTTQGSKTGTTESN
jgi:hypothetical protein